MPNIINAMGIMEVEVMQKNYSPMDNPEKFFDMKRCPLCGHDEIYVERTEHPIRRYRCKKCRGGWKGVMIFLAYENSLDLAAECCRLKRSIDDAIPFL